MASVRVGFLFNDNSFFNSEVDATEIGPLYGVNGNWRASLLAGKVASQNGIEPTSVELKTFVIGGHHAGQVEDNILYHVQEMNEEMNTTKKTMEDAKKEATPIEQPDVSGPKRKLFEETTVTNITPPPSMIEEQPSMKKKSKKSDKENEAPSWFNEWATTNQHIMKELVEQTKRKNDLLEKLLEKL